MSNKTDIDTTLYELLKSCVDRNGLPVMNTSLFVSTTEKYGKELFRSTLSEFITFNPVPANADCVTNDLPEPGPPAKKNALNIPGS